MIPTPLPSPTLHPHPTPPHLTAHKSPSPVRAYSRKKGIGLKRDIFSRKRDIFSRECGFFSREMEGYSPTPCCSCHFWMFQTILKFCNFQKRDIFLLGLIVNPKKELKYALPVLKEKQAPTSSACQTHKQAHAEIHTFTYSCSDKDSHI